ncbi:MAG: VF530 family DNA-binding protein [Mariprofundaceae bacterium]|nr:VF530 family DNA-binding protein [Mariprofundaceae bacterium]
MMNDKINYGNNPLHGLGLKNLVIDIVDQYGFEILFAYLNINCFNTNPSIDSSVKFLKKTDWARKKVEAFYMYDYKNLPRASYEQFLLMPRDRVVPEGQVPGNPKELSLEDAERLSEERIKKSAERLQEKHANKSTTPDPWGKQSSKKKIDPWGNQSSKKKIDPWARKNINMEKP